MNDAQHLQYRFTGTSVSGPWRLSVWRHRDEGTVVYVFAEEHGNAGPCHRTTGQDLTPLVFDIIQKTSRVHVFLEHFIHTRESMGVSDACFASARQDTLKHLRNCLQFARNKTPGYADRIHFIDPRMDLVAILPDGNVYKAVSHYITHLDEVGDFPAARRTVYEAFVHPLLSLVPDRVGLEGRMERVMERTISLLTPRQRKFFTLSWETGVVGNVARVVQIYKQFAKPKHLKSLLQAYTDMVNHFTDLWLLAEFFVAQNYGMTAGIVYAGSRHSLNFENFLEELGYEKIKVVQNRDLSACLAL
ncbi:unknown [Feldmannia species virus]|uniref:Uncharacterized protein n=1 Tax=Feldmannia species virus TaxID=39420 RepID=B5LWA8_9PHYC|nr:hypothetical protein FeldSpV_gp019 [Feldmannia species virus]ACH46771.1 unknown [Feldmannia species virus]